MIESTDEMVQLALDIFLATPPDSIAQIDAGMHDALAAVLAIVEREYVILPRGAQALCCREHPDRPVRWGQCGACIAEVLEEDRS